MTEQHQVYQYKVQYQWKGKSQKPTTLDFAAPNLKSLLKILDQGENVNTGNTSFLIVHQINHDGTVSEVVSHDEESSVVILDNRGVDKRQQDIIDATNVAVAVARRTRRLERPNAEHRQTSTRYADRSWWEKMFPDDKNQDKVIQEIENALTKAQTSGNVPVAHPRRDGPEFLASQQRKLEQKPRIKLKTPTSEPFTIGGFFYKAFEANGWRRRPLQEESTKHGVKVNA